MFRRLSLAALMCLTLATVNLAAQQTLAAQGTSTEPTAPPVDINSASLDEIAEIFEDEQLSEKIVEGRPYANKRQLLTRDLVTLEEYDRIKDRIVARRVQNTP